MNMNGVQCSMDFLPNITEDHLIYFSTHCRIKKLKYDTIKLYLAGIRYYYLRAEHYDPTEKTERLTYIMRGIKKSQVNIPKNRLPITAKVLKQLCNLLADGVFSPFIDLMLQCAFETAFFGFLRCGEFTCRVKDAYSEFLTIADIAFVHEPSLHYVVTLETSKTDPFRKGINININDNDSFTPVETMQKYLAKRRQMGATFDSPLFVESELDFKPLSRETFISSLRELLTRLGYNEN